MKTKRRQSGLSLTEIAVIIATIALLVGLGVPAVRAFIKSFETGSSTKSIISGALFNARAIAAKEQKYAGVRFQQDLAGNQYVIFIVHEEPRKMGNLTTGFRAVKGLKPIKLPETVSVMDLRYRPDLIVGGDGIIDSENEFSNPIVVTDTTTFSIIFSSSGRLVTHPVRARNKDGVYRPNNDDPDPDKHSMDDIFNSEYNVSVLGIGRFIQDDYRDNPDLGLWEEYSRNSFIIYEQKEFKRAYESGQGWSGYLSGLEPFYINAYMGTIIEQD